MGDAGAFLCPPTPPAWAFPVPLDLSQWIWEPPLLGQPAEQEQLPRDDARARQLSSTLSLSTVWSRWLQECDDKPHEVLSEDLDDASLMAVLGTQDQQTSFAAAMDTFRWAATYATPAVLAAHIEDICPKFQQEISLGKIAPEHVLPLSAEIWGALESRYQGSPLGHRLSLMLCKAILTASTTSQLFSSSLLDARFWNTFLIQMSKIPADDELSDLFVDVMMAMPAVDPHRVSEGILCVLGGFFAAWSRTPGGPNAAEITHLLDINMLGKSVNRNKAKRSALTGNLRHAHAITKALQAVTPDEPKGFLDAANRLVLKQAAASETGGPALRYTWLSVLAQMPRVNQDYMFDAAAALSHPSLKTVPIPGFELCSLLLTHWKSRGYHPAPLRKLYPVYQRYCQGRDDAALSSLFRAIIGRGQREALRGLYFSCWRFLAKLDRMDDVFWSLRCDAQTNTLCVQMLEELATTSDNHYVAIRIHDLWARQLKPQYGPQFNPNVFLKYVDRIVLDPQIPPKTIWRVLEIKQFENRGTNLREKTRRHHGTYGEARANIVEKVSAAFTNAPHLRNRVALRHVSQGLYYITAVRGHVPYTVIRDLYHVVTKDLVERKPGRTKRLLWFLGIVQAYYGHHVAWNCRLVLRNWRARLTRVWISMGFNRTE